MFPPRRARYRPVFDRFSCDAAETSLREHLVRRGWCPSIRRILSETELLVPEYASVIGPPSIYASHESCSELACNLHNIDESTYVVKHTGDCTGCRYVRPSIPELKGIIAEPLINIRELFQDPSLMTVNPVPFTAERRFVAISHVWSGRLGSCSEDGLPLCQIADIVRFILPNEGWDFIWMDSLCIPRD